MTTIAQHHPIFDECKGERCRYALDHVWACGGFLYATDGRILVRCKTDEPDTEKINGAGFPDAAVKFVGRWSDKPLTLPDTAAPSVSKCTQCDGDGTYRCNCPSCYEPVHSCEECDKGTVTRYATFQMGNVVRLYGKYLDILVRHGCKVYPNAKGSEEAVRFVFEGGEGVLMPMAPYTKAHDAQLDDDAVMVPQ